MQNFLWENVANQPEITWSSEVIIDILRYVKAKISKLTGESFFTLCQIQLPIWHI